MPKFKIDKDQPSTWVKYKDSLCKQCTGVCCTMPVEVKIDDLLRLKKITEDDLHISKRKLVNRLKKEGLIISYRESTELFMLSQRPNGDCLFLDENSRRCTVYSSRPEMCRRFPTQAGLRLGFCPMNQKPT